MNTILLLFNNTNRIRTIIFVFYYQLIISTEQSDYYYTMCVSVYTEIVKGTRDI